MRLLLLPALALLAAPAFAQTDDAPRSEERSVIIERDGDAPMFRRMVIVDGDTTVDERFGGRFESAPGENVFEVEGDGENVFRLRSPEGVAHVFRLRGPGGAVHLDDGAGPDVFRLRMRGGPGTAFFEGDGPMAGPMRELMGRMMGSGEAVSDETRDRMRSLEREAQELARAARDGDAAAERELDAVLGDLFEARAEARREQAAHLRAEADRIEAALADREARREALIEARRAELLGRTAAGW